MNFPVVAISLLWGSLYGHLSACLLAFYSCLFLASISITFFK